MGYVVCWLDSHDAKIFTFSADSVEKTELHIKKEDHGVDHFYHRIAEALKPAFEILVVGPGMAKTQLVHHINEHGAHSSVAKKIKGVENMDHPTDGQIVAHARKFFQHLEVFKSI